MTTGSDRRRTMLERIKTGLNDGTPAKVRRETVAARLAGQAAHLIPERARKDAAGLRALFIEYLQGQSATVLAVASEAEIPAAVAGYLRGTNLPMRLRHGDDAGLGALPWSNEPTLSLEHGRAQPGDEVGLSRAAAGVAETGTLVMLSGADNPVTLNYLPENHIVVVSARDIAGSYEAAFEKVRARLGRGVMPRTVNLISGPSRSADIGGRPVLGAHGPRRLCVIVVGS